MEENHPIEKLMVTAMNSIKDMIDANTIVGEPIEALNNTVIIPISKVGFGFAAGGSEFTDETVNYYSKKDKEENVKYRLPFGGGSGAGVSITPIAFLIVQNDNVKLIEASHSSVLDKLVEYIPDAMDKINSLIKKKIENHKEDDENDYDDDGDFEDVDDEYEDDDWVEEEQTEDEIEIDYGDEEEEGLVKENEEGIKKKKENKTKEEQKKDVNQIIDNGKTKSKKLEEKIKELKKEGNKQ